MANKLISPIVKNDLPVVVSVDDLLHFDKVITNLTTLVETAKQYENYQGPVTKEDYHGAQKLKRVALKVRTDSVKLVASKTQPYKDVINAYKQALDGIIERAKVAEDITGKVVKAYEDAEEAERLRKKEESANERHRRTQAIINLGMTFTGSGYELDGLVINNIDIDAAPADKWETLYNNVLTYHQQKDAERIAANVAAEAESARIEAEQLAEWERIQQAKADLVKEQKKLKEDQERVAAQQQLIADAGREQLRLAQEAAQRIIDEESATELQRITKDDPISFTSPFIRKSEIILTDAMTKNGEEYAQSKYAKEDQEARYAEQDAKKQYEQDVEQFNAVVSSISVMFPDFYHNRFNEQADSFLEQLAELKNEFTFSNIPDEEYTNPDPS